MTSKHWLLKTAAALAVLVILAGCTGQKAVVTLEPTIALGPTLDSVATQAAQTVIAGLTQNAPTATPPVPTSTIAPSATLVPSFTPLPTWTSVPPTLTPIPWTVTPFITNTPISYKCSVVEQSPVSSDPAFPASAPFDGRWKVENTGSTTWDKSAVDFKYIGGTKFQDNDVNLLDLPNSVAEDGTITMIIDMTAPKTPGTYSATWAFVQGSKILCPVYLTIRVK